MDAYNMKLEKSMKNNLTTWLLSPIKKMDFVLVIINSLWQQNDSRQQMKRKATVTITKNVYYNNNKKNRCNNIKVITIVYAKCCNKI